MFHLAAIVKVVKLLLEVVEYLRVSRHVCRQDENYHVSSHLAFVCEQEMYLISKYAVFLNIVQKGGGIKPMFKKYRIRNGILT